MGSAALRVPDSSLTFLKRSGSGGTVSQTGGTVNSTKDTVKISPKADVSDACIVRLEAEEKSVDDGSRGEKTPPGLETLEKGDTLDSWEDFDESSLSSLPSMSAQATLAEKDYVGKLVGSKESNDCGGDRGEAADVEEDPVGVEVRAFEEMYLLVLAVVLSSFSDGEEIETYTEDVHTYI